MSLRSDLVSVMNGAGITFYPQGVPEDQDLPFVVYRVLNSDPLTTLDDTETLINYQVAFECYDDNLADAETLAGSVTTAIEGSSLVYYKTTSPGEDYIQLIDGYMEPVFFGIWHS